ncbi:MAG: hypothetical protein MJ082_01540 [Clostridia bacterium]|nr:hypothetical protein [Clostridia bacterium]
MITSHTEEEYKKLQEGIDRITPAMFEECKLTGDDKGEYALRTFLNALPKAVEESRKVGETPAVWLIYNMGLLVKTKETFFSVDLCHPGAVSVAPMLDFAMITHNHDDHYTDAFYNVMNGELKKTVVNNFEGNYGGYRGGNSFGGGYTRGGKTFEFGDVKIITSSADHNGYLIDFTMPFEIHIGDLVLYHTGDVCNVNKLNPTVTPDIWFVHPECGLKVVDGYNKFRPKLTVIGHLNEMGHAKDRWRWSFEDGFRSANAIRELGGEAIVPLWGDRVL